MSFIALFSNLYLLHPLQIWQLIVLRVLSATSDRRACSAWHEARFGFILKGLQNVRLSACYSLHFEELADSPSYPSFLPPNSTHELQVAVRSGPTNYLFMLLNAVEVGFKQHCVPCLAPSFNRAFEMHLPCEEREFEVASGGRKARKCNLACAIVGVVRRLLESWWHTDTSLLFSVLTTSNSGEYLSGWPLITSHSGEYLCGWPFDTAYNIIFEWV